jgi:hypothetical protein
MRIRKGEQWRCFNHACGSGILVLASSELAAGTNPRCSCGSIMKKPYLPPQIMSRKAQQAALELSKNLAGISEDSFPKA